MSQDSDIPQASTKTLTAKARTGFLWLGSTTAIWQVVSWALTLVTARLLLPEDYGLIALIETITPYLALVATLNLTTWMIQTQTFAEHQQAAMFTLVLLLGAIMTAVAFVAAPYIADFYHRPELAAPFKLVSITFLMRSVYALSDSLLRRDLNFKAISILNLVTGITRSILQLGLAYLGFGYWALVWGIVFRELVMMLSLCSIRKVKWKFEWDRDLYKQSLNFGATATLATITWIVFSTADKVIVGKLFGITILGFYSMAFYLTELPMSKINSVLRPVLLPYFSQLKAQPDELRQAFKRISSAYVGVIFPVLFGLALVAPDIVPLLLGKKWIPMIAFLQVICFASAVRVVLDLISPLLVALGRPEKEFQYNLLQALALPAAFFVLGKLLGINGIFISWLIVFPIISLYLLFTLKNVFQITPLEFLYNLRVPLAATSLMAVAVLLTANFSYSASNAIAHLVLKVVVGGVVYCAVYWRLGQQEIRALRALF